MRGRNRRLRSRSRAAFILGHRRLVAPPRAHLREADLRPRMDQRRPGFVVHEDVLRPVLGDPPRAITEAVVHLRGRLVPQAGRAA